MKTSMMVVRQLVPVKLDAVEEVGVEEVDVGTGQPVGASGQAAVAVPWH